MHACVISSIQLFVTPWTVAYQAPLSIGFSRQEYWRRLPFPSPGDLPDPGIKAVSLMSPSLADGFFNTRATWEALSTTGANIYEIQRFQKNPDFQLFLTTWRTWWLGTLALHSQSADTIWVCFRQALLPYSPPAPPARPLKAVELATPTLETDFWLWRLLGLTSYSTDEGSETQLLLSPKSRMLSCSHHAALPS